MTWHGNSPNRIRGRAGQAQRARILARDPICRECIRQGKVTKSSISTIADHVINLADGGTNDDENFEGLCKMHSDEKTAREAAKAQGREPPKVRPRIGLDGWPID